MKIKYLSLLILTGYSVDIQPIQIQTATAACDSYGGVEHYTFIAEARSSVRVKCNNGLVIEVIGVVQQAEADENIR